MNKKPETVKPKTISKFRIISGVTFIFLSIVLTLSFISYLMKWKADQSQAGTMLDKTIKSSNIFGKIGDWLGNFFIFESIGIAGFIIAFLFFVFGTLILKKNYFKPWKTISHSLFFICWLPIFIGAITKGQGVLSGVYGFQMMDYLNSIIGTVGLWMVLLLAIGLYFVLEFNLRPSNIKARLNKINDNTLGKIKNIIPGSDDNEETEGEEGEDEEILVDEEPKVVNLTQKGKPSPFEIHPKTEEAPVEPKNNFVNGDLPRVEIHKTEEPIIETPNHTTLVTPVSPVVVAPPVTPPVVVPAPPKPNNDLDIAFSVEKKVEEPIETLSDTEKKSQELVEKHGLYDHRLDLAQFQLPPVTLLKDYGNENININQAELEENKNRIVGLLKNFNVGITEIKATIGPTVTLYEIVPEAGIRVAQIKKLQDDIALNLSALGIRIIAPMPGKGTIGIEVPNQKPSMVSMRSVIASPKFQNTDMDLPVVFGKTISNEIFMADLSKMPHLLMAGATGQGKSVGINAILT